MIRGFVLKLLYRGLIYINLKIRYQVVVMIQASLYKMPKHWDSFLGFTHSGKEVGNEWKGISVFFGYFIETLEIYAEAEGFIFLEGKDY